MSMWEKETGTLALKFTLKTICPRDTISLHSHCKSTTQLCLLTYLFWYCNSCIFYDPSATNNQVSSFISVTFASFCLHSLFMLLNYIHNPLFIIFVGTLHNRDKTVSLKFSLRWLYNSSAFCFWCTFPSVRPCRAWRLQTGASVYLLNSQDVKMCLTSLLVCFCFHSFCLT